MSFRSSRSRAPLETSSRRRSLSSSRVPSSTSSSSYSSYNSRPISSSSSYYTPQSSYQSPYASLYGSRENLFNRSNSFYASKSNYSKYNPSSYISPYTSYENGITTAGLSLSIASKAGNGYTPSSTYSPRSTTSRLANGKTSSLSNSSLNSYSPNTTATTAPTTSVSVPSAASIVVSRSSSLREHERKSRNRTRSRNVAQRSLSASSEKSEGYESGTERTARSRLGSTNSLAADGDNKQSNENGEIDYKALWEAAMLENDKLKQMLKKKDEEIVTAKAAVERFAHTTNKNSLSENEKRERRAMERKMSEMEEELKQLDAFKTENKRLKEENGALIRVISKLSK